MAGSYLHLHLATGSFRSAFGDDPLRRPLQHAAFLAGSVAPDLGFFPGGPSAFSHRVHHQGTADLVRSLLAAADDEIETAFAAGWALHVCTDVTTHPVVNRRADDLRQERSRQPPSRRDLWHKRVEWGMDCHVLGVLEPRPLWRTELHFPAAAGRPSLLATAAAGVFGEGIDDSALRAGWSSTLRWVRRLAPIFAWTGACRSPGHGRTAAAVGPVLQPLARSVGRLLQDHEAREDEAAVLSPEPPPPAFADSMMEAGKAAVATFLLHWCDRFESLPNLDLDTGEPIAGGPG